MKLHLQVTKISNFSATKMSLKRLEIYSNEGDEEFFYDAINLNIDKSVNLSNQT